MKYNLVVKKTSLVKAFPCFLRIHKMIKHKQTNKRIIEIASHEE